MNYFRYKQFNKDVITVAVGYYLRYALSYRDISEILSERGVNVHHSTVYRWGQEYAPIRYQSINTAKNTLKGIECIYALYKKNRRSLQIYGFSPCHEISIMLAS
ncbi:TPA: hypothetical protein ACOHAY_002892 [Staphylococcus aureus]